MGSRYLCLAAAFALSGCALDTLRIDGANDVATASTAVVMQANTALDQAKERRQRAYATLIASDPSCLPVSPLYVFVPLGPPTKGAPVAPLCADGKDDKFPGYRVEKRETYTIGAEALRPTVALIGALADYEAALAKVVAEPKPDVSKELQGIFDKASDARTIAELLSGSTLPKLPDLASKQAKAATDILQFAAELLKQHGQAKEIRQIVLKQHDKIDAVKRDLVAQIDEWQTVASTGYAEVVAANLRRAYASGRRPMDFAARLELLVAITQADSDLGSIPQTTATLKKAVEKFGDADTTLANRLSGNLSAADKKRAAEIARQQIFEGIHLIASAVEAWGIV